jgi:hypothetical protein
MMIRLSVFFLIMVIRIQAAVDPVGINPDPKHELLTEIAGRYELSTILLRIQCIFQTYIL